MLNLGHSLIFCCDEDNSIRVRLPIFILNILVGGPGEIFLSVKSLESQRAG
jgi:hypothetical protein